MNSQNLYSKIRLAMITVVFLALSTFTSHAQLKIGLPAGTAAASAVLDASNTGGGSLGFLAPQVALTSLTVAGPVTSPATGLLVYNTATAGTAPNNVVPGFYYWNASQWVKMVVTASTTADGNIYANDGTLAGARTVTQGANNLTFSSTTGNLIFNPTSTGRVAIGTAAPTASLDVNGNARIRTIPAAAATSGTVNTLVVDGSGNIQEQATATSPSGTLFSHQGIAPTVSVNFFTIPVVTNGVDNSWDLTVTMRDGCAENSTYKFVVTSGNFGGSAFVGGGRNDGFLATNQVTGTRTATTQTWKSTGLWGGCGDGNAGVTDAFTLTLTYTTTGSNTTAVVSVHNDQTAGAGAHDYYVSARQLF